jgi:Flp pilus assembly CpaF family ATPase
MAMQTDCSMLIAGNTGSGKTSTLNALFCFIPKDERIIAVEETPEIRLLHKHFVKLNVVDNLKIGMQQLIIDSLRMRPDRIIVGEIRNSEETLAFIDTLLAGQGKGSYATFHAQSSEETLLRLKSIGVNQLDLASIDLIIVQRRWNKIDKEKATATEQRRVIEISEVLSDINGAKLNCLYCYNNKNNELETKNQSEKVLEKIKKCFGVGEKELQKELEKRASFLESQTKEGLKIEEFFEKINRGNILE